ncbi:MAG: hypothetical protein ACNA7W_18810 [Pseudomonadales bacterium]
MAKLPEPQHTTLRAIERAVEAEAESGFRAHLGASVIGQECERAVWYGFRWATERRHPGRILRLFARGQREEAVLVDLLRKAGVEVWEADDQGRQFRVSAVGGHFGGSLDGVGRGFVEAPEKPHVLEFKTSGDKAFRDLVKHGVEKSKPEHYAQMMAYMHLMGIDRAYYLAVNKNDDSLHAERVRYSAAAGDAVLAKAQRVIASDRPLPKLSDDPAFFKCKWCDHAPTCHGQAVPVPTCRSCVHATPEMDGNGRWSCAALGKDLTADEQLVGCPSHAFIPDLLASWAEQTDVNGVNIEYSNRRNGLTFANGPGAYSSAELYQAGDLGVIGDEVVDELRRDLGGRACG